MYPLVGSNKQGQLSWLQADLPLAESNLNTFLSSPNVNQDNARSISLGTSKNDMALKVSEENNKLMQEQFKRMETFEVQQQEQFRRDLEDQRRLLDIKQKEYKTAIEQQRNMTQDKIRAMQERQSAMMRQQQLQADTVLKQLQSQMESETRIKNEMVRNQLCVFSEIQAQNPVNPVNISSLMQELQGKTDANNTSCVDSSATAVDDLEGHYQKKIERLCEMHKEEINELKERNHSLVERSRNDMEDHQKELELERNRRLQDLDRLREEHNKTLENLRSEYIIAVEKV